MPTFTAKIDRVVPYDLESIAKALTEESNEIQNSFPGHPDIRLQKFRINPGYSPSTKPGQKVTGNCRCAGACSHKKTEPAAPTLGGIFAELIGEAANAPEVRADQVRIQATVEIEVR